MQNDRPSEPPSSLAEDPFEGTGYRGLRRLGAGGMGEVYLVEHRTLGRECVAKVLHRHLAGDSRLVDRVRVEAQALGRLRHPHVVSVYGFDTTGDGRPFIVMERLQGRTLTEELTAAGGRLPVGDALSYADQLLAGLSAVHALGLVHRDIKPDNLFICEGLEASRQLKVLDFGVVRVLPGAPQGAPAPAAVPTETGVLVGTPRFLSPEAVAGRRADPRADLYAAALVLYTMIAGRGPFDHIQDEERLLSAHALDDPEPPSRFVPARVPAELDRAVLRALAKDPDTRFQSAEEMRGCLQEVARGLPEPEGSAEAPSPYPDPRSNPAPSGLASPRPEPTGSPSPPQRRRTAPAQPRPRLPSVAVAFLVAAAVGAALFATVLGLVRTFS